MAEAERVLIVGGGVTGMQAATLLGQMEIPSILVEKSDRLGGRVRRLSRTFPFFNEDGFVDGLEFVADIERQMRAGSMVDVRLGTSVRSLEGQSPQFRVGLSDGSEEPVSAIALTTGFEPFDPTSLEEYGYGRYPNVVTATELEWMLNPRGPTGGELLRPSDRKPVDRLAIVFCVGSRNRRIGAPFCSRICCSYSTKQAITVRERNPKSFVACFFIDVRTYDRGFEEMYFPGAGSRREVYSRPRLVLQGAGRRQPRREGREHLDPAAVLGRVRHGVALHGHAALRGRGATVAGPGRRPESRRIFHVPGVVSPSP